MEYTFPSRCMYLGAFQPISEWSGEAALAELFGRPTLKWCALDAHTYGTPQYSRALALSHRHGIYDKYGLQASTTWEESAEQARKLHSQAPIRSTAQLHAAPSPLRSLDLVALMVSKGVVRTRALKATASVA